LRRSNLRTKYEIASGWRPRNDEMKEKGQTEEYLGLSSTQYRISYLSKFEIELQTPFKSLINNETGGKDICHSSSHPFFWPSLFVPLPG
jgi:hypothetical protein